MSRWSSWPLAALLLVGSGCRRASEQAPESEQAPTRAEACGRLVFVESDAGGHGRVRVMPAVGGPITPLTAAPLDAEGSSYPVAQSPDGRTLLLLSSRERPDGLTSDRLWLGDLGPAPAEPRPLALEPDGQLLRSPSWAPDGSWLVLESAAHSFRDLYRVEVGTGSVLRLTDDAAGNFEPAISPDGQRIAFVSSSDGNAEIYVMSSDGGDPRRLTSAAAEDKSPRWSPDGRTIAFRSGRDRARGVDVFVMDADGGNQRPLLADLTRAEPILARQLEFSPDGSQLAFTELSARRGTSAIVVVALATGEVAVRSSGDGIDEQPSWSPDGRFLAFARSHGEQSDIARVRADGSDLVILTDGTGERWLPRWIADPECPRVVAAVDARAGVG